MRRGRQRVLLPGSRNAEAMRARRQLQHHGWPRLQMALIVVLTVAAEVLASHVLRLLGMDAMLLRHPLAVLVAYGVFLLLMWFWIRWRWDAVVDALGSGPGGGGSQGSPWRGSGGHSGGGGASASWGESAASSSTSADSTSLLDIADGEASLPLLAVLGIIALVATVLLATVWVVWSAPVLMVELLVDAAIAGGLYKRMQGMQGMQAQGWWRLCMSHTIWPLLGLLVFFAGLGWLAQELAPDAVSLMQVFKAF